MTSWNISRWERFSLPVKVFHSFRKQHKRRHIAEHPMDVQDNCKHAHVMCSTQSVRAEHSIEDSKQNIKIVRRSPKPKHETRPKHDTYHDLPQLRFDVLPVLSLIILEHHTLFSLENCTSQLTREGDVCAGFGKNQWPFVKHLLRQHTHSQSLRWQVSDKCMKVHFKLDHQTQQNLARDWGCTAQVHTGRSSSTFLFSSDKFAASRRGNFVRLCLGTTYAFDDSYCVQRRANSYSISSQWLRTLFLLSTHSPIVTLLIRRGLSPFYSPSPITRLYEAFHFNSILLTIDPHTIDPQHQSLPPLRSLHLNSILLTIDPQHYSSASILTSTSFSSLKLYPPHHWSSALILSINPYLHFVLFT